MHNDIETSASEQQRATFAKLMTYEQRQVLAYLYRDDSDQLTIIIQAWVARTDEQLRAVISFGDDAIAEIAFEMICDDSIGLLMEESGLNATLAQAESANS